MKDIIESLPVRFGHRKTKKSFIYELLWIISSAEALMPNRVTDAGFTILSSRFLNSKIPQYKRYLDYLEEKGVIECDKIYIGPNISDPFRKSKAYGYRITRPFWEKVDILLTDTSINSELTFFTGEKVVNAREYPFLVHSLLKELELERKDALDSELSIYKGLSENSDSWPISKHTYRPIHPIYQYVQNRRFIERFHEHKYNFSVSQSTGRFHTVITYLPRRLRLYLRSRNEPLVSLDISSANLYFLTVLFNPEFWRNARGVFGLNNLRNASAFLKYKDTILQYLDSTGFCRRGSGTPSLMLDRHLSPEHFESFSQFLAEISAGEFYRRFLERGLLYTDSSNIAYDGIYELEDCKVGILKFLNASHLYRSAVQRAFRREYPFVNELLKILKTIDRENRLITHKDKSGIFLEAPCLLMSVESTLMLDRVAKRINRLYPKCPIYTIHDSILTTPEWMDTVKAELSSTLERCVGLAPHIKIEYLFNDCCEHRPEGANFDPNYFRSTEEHTAKICSNDRYRSSMVSSKRV